MENQFISFIKPFLQSIDSGAFFGKPFRWLYMLFAGINLLVPVIVMITAIKNNIFDSPFKFGVTFFLLWVIIGIASWVSFQIWWNRRNQLNNGSGASLEFVATPVMAHLIQTIGESLGSQIAIVGTSFSLIAGIILGDEASSLAYRLNLNFLVGGGFFFAFVFPVIGYLIIVFSRYLSEQIKALATIANNTKK